MKIYYMFFFTLMYFIFFLNVFYNVFHKYFRITISWMRPPFAPHHLQQASWPWGHKSGTAGPTLTSCNT